MHTNFLKTRSSHFFLSVTLLFLAYDLPAMADTISPQIMSIVAPNTFFAPPTTPSNHSMRLNVSSVAPSLFGKTRALSKKAEDFAGLGVSKRAVSPTGNVACEFVQKGTNNIVGYAEVHRNNPIIHDFITTHDAEAVKAIQSYLLTWDAETRSIYNLFEGIYCDKIGTHNKHYHSYALTLYGCEFAPSAIHHIALKNVAPSRALYTLHYGKSDRTLYEPRVSPWGIFRYVASDCNTQILVEKEFSGSIRIIAIAPAAGGYVEMPTNPLEQLRMRQKFKTLLQNQEKETSNVDKEAEASKLSEIPDFPDNPNDPDDPDNNKNKNLLDKCRAYFRAYLRKFNEIKRHHVCRDKHCWQRLVADPENNWDKIVEYLVEVLIEGKESLRRDRTTFEKVKRIGNHIVKVTYKKIGKKITDISNGWIEDDAKTAQTFTNRFF